MIGWRPTTPPVEDLSKPKGYDDYTVSLGDIMRGERATLGKSLLDVQRELRIKASYIAAIENTDATVFDAPSFVAGYVRSYAKYLGMDQEATFQRFCEESGFTVAHGMSPAASRPREQGQRKVYSDPLADPNPKFLPAPQSLLSHVEPRAIGSIIVLIAMIAGLGYGGWSVLQQVQRVQLAPVEEPPGVVADLDPVAGVTTVAMDEADPVRPESEALDRLYRPEALDVPVLEARDGPISAIRPDSIGALASVAAPSQTLTGELPAELAPTPVQVVAEAAPELAILAVRPAWVRVQAADGTIILEKILDAGERFEIPATEEPPVLRAGNSGAVYFAVNGQTYGPAAPGASVVKNLKLSATNLTEAFQVADVTKDPELARIVAVAEAVE